jgi:Protein kinase domain
VPDDPSASRRSETRRADTADAALVDGYDDPVEVGRGGFGVVYRAEQREFDRTVALKVLTGTVDDSARARFERECRAMGALSDHPNIVTVFAAGTTRDGRPYLAMEYLPGGSLAERLVGHRLVWPQAVTVGVKIAGALQRAHDGGVLHRDVKPENILVSAYDEPMLGDFGVARLQGGYVTRSGVITATFAHAAPEVLDGQAPTTASDVYSLASTIYSLIAGRPPFVQGEEDTLPAVIARIATASPPDLRAEGVPDGVATVLEHALEKDPKARTASAAAFGRELAEAARAAGVEPPPLAIAPARGSGDRPRRTRGPARRWVALGAAVILLGLGGGLAVALSGGSGSTPTTTTASTLAPPMPATLAGYRKAGAATTGTQRVFTGKPTFLDNFPWTMNGCADTKNTTQWRVLVPSDVVAGGQTDQHGSTTLQVADAKSVTTGRAGLIVGDGCQEPVFFFVNSPLGDTLVDVAYTTQHWTAAP